MNNIKIAAASLNQTALDFDGNYHRILDVIDAAIKDKISLLLLPELCISGYGCEDAFFSRDVQLSAKEYLKEIIRYLQDKTDNKIAVSVGLPYFLNGAIYNVAALINRYGVIAFIPKQNLANDGVHYENRWFKAWEAGKLDHVEGFWPGEKIPFGDLLIEFDNIKIGYEICQDAWVSNRPGINHAKHGVDIILNPSASHFAFGKHEVRKQFVKEGSRAFKCAYVYANLLGNESGSSIFDGDTLIATGGNIIASGKRLSFKDYVLTSAVIDTDEIKTIQTMDGSFRVDLNSYSVVAVNYNLHTVPLENNTGKLQAENWSKEEEFIHAEALGIFDYLRKSNACGFVCSLSGGVDSTVCCILIKFMHDFAIKELGVSNFIKKCNIKCISTNLMAELLTCVYQKTENSSNESLQSAKSVAEAIGATFINWEIDKIINEYKSLVEIGLNINLTWDANDIALQNIQARTRIPGLWMIANIKNALLICTSNRSEMAVGYSTADGDLSGSIAPIAGVSKEFLLNWLCWIQNNDIVKQLEWLNCLIYVNNLKPSAELRPLHNKQTDEQDLMSYEILDAIEYKAIVQKKSPKEVLEYIKIQFKSIDNEILRANVNKFFKLWSKNQWKKYKAPISFMLDEYCLDPKTWTRFPVLSGSFDEI